jgi:hypothetical protein
VLRNAAGIGIAVGAYGLSFGAAAVAAGLSTLQACALSLLMFTGASQFAAVGVLGAAGPRSRRWPRPCCWGPGTRCTRCGSLRWSRPRGPRRLLAAQLTIDESTGMATACAARLRRHRVLGHRRHHLPAVEPDDPAGRAGRRAAVRPGVLGLDAAVPAAFLALLWPQLRERRLVGVAVGGALLALAAVPLTPPGVPVLLAGLAVLPVLLSGDRTGR